MAWLESASHVPVLVLIPKLVKINSVLEIGSGELSTLLFLNREIYPNLKNIDSVEDDNYWLNKICSLINDPRIQFFRDLKDMEFDYDLVLVDGPQYSPRQPFINLVASLPLVLVHDYDKYKYSICKPFEFVFDFVTPNTGVFSDYPLENLHYYNELFKREFYGIEENWTQWNQILASFS